MRLSPSVRAKLVSICSLVSHVLLSLLMIAGIVLSLMWDLLRYCVSRGGDSSTDPREFHPSHVFITGASSGLGQHLAELYAKRLGREVRLTLTGRNGERLEAVAAQCKAYGVQDCSTHLIDVTDYSTMQQVLLERDDIAPIDCVIANAGITTATTPGLTLPERARRMLAVNVEGVFNTVFPLLDRWRERSSQQRVHQIAFMSSLAGVFQPPPRVSYPAMKQLLVTMTRGLRDLLGPHGIRVNVICPGYVATPATDVMVGKQSMPLRWTVDTACKEIVEAMAEDVPMIVFPAPLFVAASTIRSLPFNAQQMLLGWLKRAGLLKSRGGWHQA